LPASNFMKHTLKNHIPIIPDFPKQGINFLDITKILSTPEQFNYCIDELAKQAHNCTSIVAIESRGFPFGGALAQRLGLPLVLVRKKGKLPGEVHTIEYDTEYSVDILQMKTNSPIGSMPFIVDDLLATGGTIKATVDLLRQHFNTTEIKAGTIINLTFLPGERLLKASNILYTSIVEYDDV
jgi:adenine phosphoribosyltransferase